MKKFSTDEYSLLEIKKNGNGVKGGKLHDEICDYLQETYRFNISEINNISMGIWLAIEAKNNQLSLAEKIIKIQEEALERIDGGDDNGDCEIAVQALKEVEELKEGGK